MNVRRVVLVLVGIVLWCVLAAEASAQCVQAPSPVNNARIVRAVAGEPIVVRLHAEACAIYTEPTTELSGNVLRVSLGADRVLPPCGVERDVDFALQALPVGSYVLLYVPEAPISLICYGAESVPFGVTPPVTAVVSLLGSRSTLLLAMLTLVLGWLALRSRFLPGLRPERR